ncbi:hypothetical protein SDC9_35824 [bioreactor metagenome]|uniref:Uncharacterized protein n=1 Tax=bioreactor metagenome TaxID=1076179 RepID=A0A644VGI7_9ZZZZ
MAHQAFARRHGGPVHRADRRDPEAQDRPEPAQLDPSLDIAQRGQRIEDRHPETAPHHLAGGMRGLRADLHAPLHPSGVEGAVDELPVGVVFPERDERHVGEIGRLEPLAGTERVVGGKDADLLELAQRDHVGIRHHIGGFGQADVEVEAGDRRLVARIGAVDPHRDLRMSPVEPGHRFGQDGLCEGRKRRDIEHFIMCPAQLVDAFIDPLEPDEGGLDLVIELGCARGRVQPLPATLEQGEAHGILETQDLARDRRLRGPKGRRRGRHGAEFHHGTKDLDLPQIELGDVLIGHGSAVHI